MRREQEPDTDELAAPESGSGGAHSPEEAVEGTPQRGEPAEESAGDQDAGPTKTAEQVEQDSERDQAEG